MVFSSLLFLIFFLPAFLLLYYACPVRYRNGVALVGSYLFYAWGAPRFVLVLAASSTVDYWLSRWIDRTPQEHVGRRRTLLIVALVLNLGLLGFFKYANFVVAELDGLLTLFGDRSIVWTKIALPIGISFFTFQKITYVVDVYRRTAPPARSLRDYLLYVAMFPQLIAGPIVRYYDVAQQLASRVHSWEKMYSGIWRFSVGLGKKVLVANTLAVVTNRVFGAGPDAAVDPATLPAAAAWVGLLCFTFQIYFDFSGYSDMALGLARMMGFELLENFDCPYIARSFTDFWRRWHISLSNFMREYLYIPLGGNRVAAWRTYANLWIVFLLSGLWHGANWTFVAWGAFHGLFLSLDKAFARRTSRRLPGLLAVPLTFVLVMVGWALFCGAMSDWPVARAGAYVCRLADPHAVIQAPADNGWLFRDGLGIGWMRRVEGELAWRRLIGNRETVVLAIAALLSFLPAIPAIDRLVHQRDWGQQRAAFVWAKFAVAMALLVLSLCSLANLNFNPFIYFRF